MTGRQHSIVKHRENYFFIPLEDDYLLAYMLLAEKLDPIKATQGKRLSGSSDCKAMIASVLEAWMNSKRPSAQSEDDLFSYFTIDQIVSELRGRYKRSMVIQCLQEMEVEGEYTDSDGEVHKGTVKKRPYKQNISSYALNLPVLQSLLDTLPAQSPYGMRNAITLGRPKKISPKTDGLKISPKINGINLDGINVNQSENGRINPINQSKNGLSFYTQNSNITQNSNNTEREGATSGVSSIAVDTSLTHSGSTHPFESVSLESGETTQPLEEKNKATTLLFPEFASEDEYGASVQDNGQTSKQASSHSQKNAHKTTSKEKKVNASTKPEPPQMPPEDAKWCDETAVQIFEAMIGRSYSKTTRAQEKTEAKRLLEMEYKGEPLTREHFLIACQDMFSWKFWAEHSDRKPMIRTLRRDDKIIGILDGVYNKQGQSRSTLKDQRNQAGIKTGVQVGSSMPPQKPAPTPEQLNEIERKMIEMGIKPATRKGA